MMLKIKRFAACRTLFWYFWRYDAIMKGKRQFKIINSVRITSTHELVLEKIKKLSHKHGYCWAFNGILADMCCLSKTRVSHIITDLVRAGMVYRFINYADDKKTVILREMTVIPEEVYTMANADADADAAEKAKDAEMKSLAEIIEDYVAAHKMSDEQQRQRGHIFSMARRLGLAPLFIVSILLKHGKEKAYSKLEKVLVAACASSAISDIYAWVTGMMRKSNINLGKRAKNEMRKPSHSVRYKTKHVIAERKPQVTRQSTSDILSGWAAKGGKWAELAAKMAKHANA